MESRESHRSHLFTKVFYRGAVSEVNDKDVTDFIVENIEESLVALENIQRFDRTPLPKSF